MSATMTEQILARAANKSTVVPGDNIWVNVDILMTHDVCGPGTIGVFKQHFGKDAKVWDREKVVIIRAGRVVMEDLLVNLTQGQTLEEVFLKAISQEETHDEAHNPAPAEVTA